jgi:hypothetical protein
MRLVVKGLLFGVCALGMIMMSTQPGDAQDKEKKDPGNEKKEGKEGKGGFGQGKGGFGQGKGGFGQGGGPGRMGGGQPGQIMPVFLREMLKMTDEQKKQMDDLQKDVDAKLEKILTEEQRKQLKEMRERGPGGFGGGPGGQGKGGFPPKKDN